LEGAVDAKHRRRIDMIVRVRALCADRPDLFESVTDFPQTLADFDAAIADLRTQLQAQDAGLAAFHEYTRVRSSARAGLRRTLDSIRAFAATLDRVGLDEAFRLRPTLSDAALIVRAGSFAADAAPIADTLVARGLPAVALQGLSAQIAALEAAVTATAERRRHHVAARAGARAAICSAGRIVKRLDAVVLHGPTRDAATIAGWKNIRRVGPVKAVDAAEPTPMPVLVPKAA
jgi:hypothetical protein